MTLLTDLRAAVSVLDAIPRGVDECRELPDAELLEVSRVLAEARRLVEAHVAVTTGEVVRRSTLDSGAPGLAQRAGHRTVEEFVRVTTGVTGREAVTAVRVGRLVHDPSGALAPVGVAVVAGTLSAAAAESIRAGLGEVSPGVPAAVITQAAERLCDEAQSLDPDRLQKRAREIRDELDEAGVGDREAARRTQRSLRLVRQPDGMTRIVWLMDPETAAVVTDVFDRLTSPRRGGPRFVDPEARTRADAIRDDDRTTEQIASDGFTELLRQAASVDRTTLLGSGAPVVRVLVPVGDLESGRGHGVLEGAREPVAIPTVDRLACAGGIQAATIDIASGQVLDLGRTQRLFSAHQRAALAVRDGGCLWPGCDRPPSWAEAHHITPWAQHGKTDVANGILLCRHHHLRLHNEGWRVTRRSGRYWLEPPHGSGRAGAMLESKSLALKRLLCTTR